MRCLPFFAFTTLVVVLTAGCHSGIEDAGGGEATTATAGPANGPGAGPSSGAAPNATSTTSNAANGTSSSSGGVAVNPLYVDGANGDDARTRDQARDPATPWATLGRAAWGSTDRSNPVSEQAAQAGDTVYVAAGTYRGPGIDDRYHITFNPVNSGTAAAPIVFEGVGEVRIELDGVGVAAGCNARDHIVWRGFVFDDAASPTWRSDGITLIVNSDGCAFERCTFVGRDPSPITGDNYVGVWLDTATHVTIRDSRFVDFGSSDHNNAGITNYYSGDILIERNEFVDSGAGYYNKANIDLAGPPWSKGGVTVRYNVFRGNAEAIRQLSSPHGDDAPFVVHQNLFVDNGIGLSLSTLDQVNEPHKSAKNCKAVNNTFVDNDVAFSTMYWLPEDSHNLAQNNLFVGGTYAVTYSDYTPQASAPYSADRVAYGHNLAWAQSRSYAVLWADERTLVEWQAATGEDAASVTADPSFVDAAGGDYHLAAGSPAASLGRAAHGVGGADGDVIPAGMYVTGNEIIGPAP